MFIFIQFIWGRKLPIHNLISLSSIHYNHV
nr:MAG TPA: hypothetical protein [Caudoviricetes sp.]